jgi:uncharacterized protein YjbI with pentapeptide repeats
MLESEHPPTSPSRPKPVFVTKIIKYFETVDIAQCQNWEDTAWRLAEALYWSTNRYRSGKNQPIQTDTAEAIQTELCRIQSHNRQLILYIFERNIVTFPFSSLQEFVETLCDSIAPHDWIVNNCTFPKEHIENFLLTIRLAHDKVKLAQEYLTRHRLFVFAGPNQYELTNHLYGLLNGVRLQQLFKLNPSCLQGVDLRRFQLRAADLSGIDFRRSNFEMADLFRANMVGCNLKEANLKSADAGEARFDNSNMRKCELQQTTLQRASFKATDLREVWVYEKRLDARELFVSGATYDNQTKFGSFEFGNAESD